MLRIVRLSLFAAGLIAVWIALLNVELDHLHHRLVLYVSLLPSASGNHTPLERWSQTAFCAMCSRPCLPF